MEAVHTHRTVAHGRGDARIGRDGHLVVNVAVGIADVLVERSSEHDIEDLGATADREKRDVPLEGGSDGRTLELVEELVDPVENRSSLLPVSLGCHVAAPEKQDAVTGIDGITDGTRISSGGEKERHGTCPLECIGVQATSAHHGGAMTLCAGGVTGGDDDEGTGHDRPR